MPYRLTSIFLKNSDFFFIVELSIFISITNSCKPGGSKQQKCSLSQSEAHKAKITVLAEACSLSLFFRSPVALGVPRLLSAYPKSLMSHGCVIPVSSHGISLLYVLVSLLAQAGSVYTEIVD